MLRPQLSPLLHLHPPSVDVQYRASRTFQRLALQADRLAVYTTIVTNLTFMLRTPSVKHDDCFQAPTYKWYLTYVLLAAAQLAWLTRAPAHYLQFRDLVLLMNR
jgi:hypothetical protein